MQTICGECNKAYSKDCESKSWCPLHQKQCFRCLACPTSPLKLELQMCSHCECLSNVEHLFFDVRCGIYFCRKEFKSFDFSKKQVSLPCGCLEMIEHVIGFLSSFCNSCGRTLKGADSKQIRHCRVCMQKGNGKLSQEGQERINNFWTKKVKMPTMQKQEKKEKKDDVLTKWLSSVKSNQRLQSTFINKPLQRLQSITINKPNKQISQSEKCIIALLNQDLKKSQERHSVSQFTRIQVKKQLLVGERDKECPICILPYSLTLNKPMMICMQQHLICEKCFKEKSTLVNCPLCSDVIVKEKVRACRERLRTLELENLMMQNYESKMKRYQSVCNNNFQELRYKYEVKDMQIQTDLEVTKFSEKKEPQCLKRPREASIPQNGQKRQKQNP